MVNNETSQELEKASTKLERDELGRLLPGQPSLNPQGKPKGTLSIKTLVTNHLKENPEDLKEFVMHFIKNNRELAWQMIEGRPPQDLTSGGEAISFPIVYYGNPTIQIPTEELSDKHTEGV